MMSENYWNFPEKPFVSQYPELERLNKPIIESGSRTDLFFSIEHGDIGRVWSRLEGQEAVRNEVLAYLIDKLGGVGKAWERVRATPEAEAALRKFVGPWGELLIERHISTNWQK